MKTSVPPNPSHSRFATCVASLVTILLASTSAAMFIGPTLAPIDRVVRNLEAYVTEFPADAEGYFLLGRAHYLAWSTRSRSIPSRPDDLRGAVEFYPDTSVDWSRKCSHDERSLRRTEALARAKAEVGLDLYEMPGTNDAVRALRARMSEIDHQLEASGWTPAQPTAKELDQHAKAGVLALRRATQLNGGAESPPRRASLHHHTLASLLEEYAERAGISGLGVDGERTALGSMENTDAWLREALGEYEQAFELGLPEATRIDCRPIDGLSYLVAYSAILGHERVAERLSAHQGPDAVDQDVVGRLEQEKQRLDALPRSNAITPILIGDRHGSLDRLLEPGRIVSFDLDGDGVAEDRSWVRPEAGILVWDPSRSGTIASGKQLFGDRTWWLFFPDGYRALDALDDDRDGYLSGDELVGLAVWYDHGSDGLAFAGEVVPIEDTEVRAIAVRPTSVHRGSPSHPAGILLDDGTQRPTWDWISSGMARRGPNL
ncbi:MAG: hypothetical protein R3E97_07495 [Candidatus Eisenbacteria bacterium]